jgi:hypothetical protein
LAPPASGYFGLRIAFFGHAAIASP